MGAAECTWCDAIILAGITWHDATLLSGITWHDATMLASITWHGAAILAGITWHEATILACITKHDVSQYCTSLDVCPRVTVYCECSELLHQRVYQSELILTVDNVCH